ncbi:MAG: EF2563 family selenium-dependent molybdenum hydroxylase system protein [Chloroflexi bacterium]|nr:EF2563 family selenium-dependent molybdenum hydroxylase system protein [Chloroflexota bacterium]MCI0578123.1 EF2563 family selenium-dependent molybdenum hydroxylase system protein [Chloroflexota bacterium]MCI0645187.1 EF2563 family selenium-dependent molybdenum hydroxylase system protein [Chloroflexota bacterium]MCI0730880.1 EF2563 family selenium-dependent molybdenum hydroxylase system protein [Chloroflexota bacterium]
MNISRLPFAHAPVLIRGGGDLATGVAYRLHQAGFPVIVLELPRPLVVRRRVALATAVLEGEVVVEGLIGRLVPIFAGALALAPTGVVPVLVSPQLPAGATALPIPILIDARLAKRNIDTRLDQAPLVIALGPGFTAGVDCHAVVETMRGHRLGRVIWQGSAAPNTGTPDLVAGKGAERVLRAPAAGAVTWRYDIGDLVAEGELLGFVAGRPVVAPFAGVLRGLIAPGTEVPAGLKIGDLDARGDVSACFTISDKALAIGGGVLEAILTTLNQAARGQSAGAQGASVLIAGTRPLADSPTLSLPAALQIGPAPEVVALVGGGGKTSLMFALAGALPGRVVTTTTTRIFAAQMKLSPAVCQADAGGLEELGRHLERFGRCLVVGQVAGDKALGVPPELPGRLLRRPDVDFVLVEADGSRMRPCKAPAGHEPVIPSETTLVVPVAGIDALGGRLAEVAHRPERAGQLTGLQPDQAVTVEALATLLAHANGGLKNVPPQARVIPFINKVESEEQLAAARRVARLVLQESRVAQVIIGAASSARPVGEIHRRVTAVVLAAGQSSRMGRTKQLLPWGETTVLGQTLRHLKQSAVHDILVVSGHAAEEVEAIAAAEGVATVRNDHYAEGEMLSSLQVAVQHLPLDRAAVLVMLADQPMVEPETIDQVLAAYWQGEGEALAPAYRGRRGNPVLIGRRHFAALLALPAGAAPRDALQEALRLVEVLADSVLQDLDRPEDYQRWQPGFGF